MRILFISHDSGLYGANSSLLNLIVGLKRNFSVNSFVIIPGEGRFSTELKKENIPFFVYPVQQWMDYFENSGNFLKKKINFLKFKYQALVRLFYTIWYIPLLVRLIKKWNIDVIYTNSSIVPVGFLISKIIKKPHIWHFREFSDLHYNYKYDWGKLIFRKIIKSSDALIAISHSIKEYYFSNIINNKIHVVYNGILWKNQFEKLKKSQRNNKNNKEFLFGIVGIINHKKRQDEAIKALSIVCQKYKNTRLIVAGSGNISELRYLAIKLKIQNNVDFLGYVENPFEVYEKVDATIVCSRYEGMGKVTVESMAAGKPVIGFKSKGTAEIIQHNVNGLLYENNYLQLASCMMRFIENELLIKRLAINAQNYAAKYFTIEEYIEKIYSVIKKFDKQIS